LIKSKSSGEKVTAGKSAHPLPQSPHGAVVDLHLAGAAAFLPKVDGEGLFALRLGDQGHFIAAVLNHLPGFGAAVALPGAEKRDGFQQVGFAGAVGADQDVQAGRGNEVEPRLVAELAKTDAEKTQTGFSWPAWA
jgi:hypothetical protein